MSNRAPSLAAPPLSRLNHPLVARPPIKGLSRRQLPMMIGLMILVWALVLGATLYKGLVPKSGAIITLDQ